MPCFHPLPAWKSREDYKTIVFKSEDGIPSTFMHLKCGKCLGCQVEKARQWAVRCAHEASMHDRNCFVTLTYDDYHLPVGGSLQPRDFVLFMKKLRKMFGRGIRYFQCGEYGEKFLRPHHHVCFFGLDFDDKIPYTTNKYGQVLYYSPILCGLWPYGFHTIGELTQESAAYTALYTIKKAGSKDYEELGLHPPYITMSRRPGIGYEWFQKYYRDIYNSLDCLVVSDANRLRPPDYYDSMYGKLNPDAFRELKSARLRAMKEVDSNEKSVARLATKEHVLKKKLLRKKRFYDGYVDDGDIPIQPLLPFLAHS